MDASWNRELARNLAINSVPSIVAVINRKVFHFNGEFHLKSLREFVRNIFPNNLVAEVNQVFIFNTNKRMQCVLNFKTCIEISNETLQSSNLLKAAINVRVFQGVLKTPLKLRDV